METAKIPISRSSLPSFSELEPYLRSIDESRIYSNFGPLSISFEERIAAYLTLSPSQIATASNATVAITGAIQTSRSSDLNDEQQLSCPAWTFAATPCAILQSGRRPRFVDVTPSNWQSEIPTSSKPGVHVLPFGAPFKNRDFENVSSKHKTPLVIDAAASFATLKDFELPSTRDWIYVVSLHATKLLGAGEGAIVVSSNEDWIAEFKKWTNFGFWGSRNSQIVGTNAKLSEYHAAVGHATLNKWERTSRALFQLTENCIEISQDLELTMHPAMASGYVSPYWIVNFDSKQIRNRAEQKLSEMNIETRRWWSEGCHRMPAFLEYPTDELPVTQLIADNSLGLPFFPEINDSELDRIKNALRSTLSS